MKTRKKILPSFITVIFLSFLLYSVMVFLQPKLTNSSFIIMDFDSWIQKAATEPLYRFLWLIGDMSEVVFHKSILGSLGLILGAFIAYILSRTKSKWQGFPIADGMFPWVFISSLIGLTLSVYLFGDNLSNGWMPTFVPFVSIPATVVLIYGGGWKNSIIGGVLGSLFTFPISAFILEKFLIPLGLPPLIGNVLGMAFGAIIVLELLNAVPWMKKPEKKEVVKVDDLEINKSDDDSFNNIWFLRRLMADFSVANFFGNEIAAAGLFIGSILSWVLNPSLIAYGSLNFPAVILSQLLAVAIGIFIYYDKWKELGFYPTFVPGVSVAPAVALFFNGSMQSILVGAFLGALAAPPLANFIINKLPDHWHPLIGNTLSMGVCTTVITLILKYMTILGAGG